MFPTTLYSNPESNEPQTIYDDTIVPQKKTYKIDWQQGRMIGMIDGLDAAAQSVAKILMTERYSYPIYDGEYGVELDCLMNQPTSYVEAHLETTITEALKADNRVISVDDFTIDGKDPNVIKSTFTVNTTDGPTSQEVIIDA